MNHIIQRYIEYFNICKHYKNLHGDKTVVLYRHGDYYEIYVYDISRCRSIEAMTDSDGKIWDESIGLENLDIAALLNVFISNEYLNRPYGISNLTCIGFSIHRLEKNRNTLLFNGYNVVESNCVHKSDGSMERVNSIICTT